MVKCAYLLSRILWSLISVEGINWYLRSFAWSYFSRDGSIWNYHFWSDVAMSLIQSDCRILGSTASLEESRHILDLLHEDIPEGTEVYETTTFGLRPLVQICVLANTIPGFFDHQYLWNELIDAFVWTLPFLLSFVIYSLASFIKLSGGLFSYSLLCTTITQFLRHITWINEIEKVLKTA